MRLRIVALMILLLFLGMLLIWVRQDIAQKAYFVNQLNRQYRQLQKDCYGCELEIARLTSTDRLLEKNFNLQLGLAPPGAELVQELWLAAMTPRPRSDAQSAGN